MFVINRRGIDTAEAIYEEVNDCERGEVFGATFSVVPLSKA